jgi:hypothetical protein
LLDHPHFPKGGLDFTSQAMQLGALRRFPKLFGQFEVVEVLPPLLEFAEGDGEGVGDLGEFPLDAEPLGVPIRLR